MGPYDSLRDDVADLEERGKLIRIKEIDQDRYESTALMFRMLDRMKDKAPGIFIEKTKVSDRWYETPVVGNLFNGYDTIAQCFGVEPVTDAPLEMYNAAVKKIEGCQQPDWKWKQIAPKEVSKEAAPVKEVILKGKDADLQKFPWIKNNACDAGQYISAGCLIMEDPELGKNVGTYRMQVKDCYKAGANFTNQSHAYAMMIKAGERNEDKVDAAVAIGIDPISWMMSSTRLADQGETRRMVNALNTSGSRQCPAPNDARYCFGDHGFCHRRRFGGFHCFCRSRNSGQFFWAAGGKQVSSRQRHA